jgi:hypothetical protein
MVGAKSDGTVVVGEIVALLLPKPLGYLQGLTSSNLEINGGGGKSRLLEAEES